MHVLTYEMCFIHTQKQTIKTLALEVISLLSRNKECVTEISACEILGQFLRIMKDDDFQKQRVLDTLSGLTNAPQLVKEAHSKGKGFLGIHIHMPSLILIIIIIIIITSTYV